MSRSTEVLPISPEAIARAAAAIRAGQLVAFPTETVYGLGANALDAAAVAGIFEAKGRPASNPVIVHVASLADGEALLLQETVPPAARPEGEEGAAHEVSGGPNGQRVDGCRSNTPLTSCAAPDSKMPPLARILAERFWPGPLTLVLPRGPNVPDIVTAGGPTVAIRVPAHPVAQDLLRACGVPIAAPSANRSTCLSPTRPEHVLRGLDGRIDILLDGGPCTGGLESTVLDLTTDPPTLLRPGLVSVKQIEEAIGPIQRRSLTIATIARSPGLMKRHYSPATPIEFAADDGRERVEELVRKGLHVGWVALGEVEPMGAKAIFASMPNDPAAYAGKLYDTFFQLDSKCLDRIVVALPAEDDAWLAVHDRLSRMRG